MADTLLKFAGPLNQRSLLYIKDSQLSIYTDTDKKGLFMNQNGQISLARKINIHQIRDPYDPNETNQTKIEEESLNKN